MIVSAVVALGMALVRDAAPALTLTWDAPPGCPSEDEVRGRVEALLSDTGPTAELHVRARAHAGTDGRWSVDLRFVREGGEAVRELTDASSCRAAAEAAAVVIAIAIDPELALAGVPEPPPAPPEAVRPTPATMRDPAAAPTTRDPAAAPMIAGAAEPGPIAPVAIDPAAPTARRRARPRGAIAIAPANGLGTQPGIAGIGRIWGAVLGRRVRGGLGVAFAGAAPIRREGVTVTLVRWTIDAHVCPVFAVAPRVEILPCGGIEAGEGLARTAGVVGPRWRRDPWVAALVQPAVAAVATRRFAVLLGGQLVVPLLRRRYVVDGLGEVYRTTPVGGGGFVAAELRIP